MNIIENRLAAFIAEIATSPMRLESFKADPEAAMADAKLSEDEREVLRKGTWKDICEFLGESDPRPLGSEQDPPEGTGGE